MTSLTVVTWVFPDPCEQNDRQTDRQTRLKTLPKYSGMFTMVKYNSNSLINSLFNYSWIVFDYPFTLHINLYYPYVVEIHFLLIHG